MAFARSRSAPSIAIVRKPRLGTLDQDFCSFRVSCLAASLFGQFTRSVVDTGAGAVRVQVDGVPAVVGCYSVVSLRCFSERPIIKSFSIVGVVIDHKAEGIDCAGDISLYLLLQPSFQMPGYEVRNCPPSWGITEAAHTLKVQGA